MKVKLISACSLNNVIGLDGDLPWRMPSDLKFYKETTMGGVLVFGRKTFDSLPGVLPGRSHWIVSRSDIDFEHKDVHVFSSIEDVINRAEELNVDTLWISGGATIYSQFLPMADEVLINRIQAEIDGDTFFPELSKFGFKLVSEEQGEKTEKDQYPYTKETWIKP